VPAVAVPPRHWGAKHGAPGTPAIAAPADSVPTRGGPEDTWFHEGTR